MSPAMLDKYLAAAKGIAAHAVLLPDGIRFSEKTTRPDWTDEILSEIKQVYHRYTHPGGNTQVKLQGIVWDSKGGGLIPLETYLAATIAHRDGGPARKRPRGDRGREPPECEVSADPLADARRPQAVPPARPRSRAMARGQARRMFPRWPAEIRQWQGALTRFGSVGHFKPWQDDGESARRVAGVPHQAGAAAGRPRGHPPSRDGRRRRRPGRRSRRMEGAAPGIDRAGRLSCSGTCEAP